jgi:putative transposase
MPWQEQSPMDLRMRFLTELRRELFSMTELCQAYGISRKTGYKWAARYETEAAAGLADRSRRPHGHPATTSETVRDALLEARRRFPLWSGVKLVQWLAKQQPGVDWPSRTTAYELLRRHGAIRQRRSPRRAPLRPSRTMTIATAANQVWTTDFKGEFRTRDGCWCHPLTVRDAFSRRVLRCDALRAETSAETRARFARAFHEFGLPDCLRSDNGRPFASTGLAGLSRLNVWWLQLGIRLERIAPGHPEQNGSHEQFHGVLKTATTRPPAANLAAQQRRFNTFCREYNEQRPHDALGGRAPADVYRPSTRPMPTRLPPLEYAAHWEVRRVASNGDVTWRGRRLFVTAALDQQRIGFEEIDDALYTVWFGSVALARFDERRWQFTSVLL